MKNIINYYYNLIITEIHQKEETYILNCNSEKYIFMPYYGNINNLNYIYNYLININIYCHRIIYNNNNSIISFIKEKPYILLKVLYDDKLSINLQDIIYYNILIETNRKCNWYNLWCEKLDYYESQVREYGKKYPLIRDSFSYYNALCETAISLLNYLNNDKLNMYINHQRINKDTDLINFYNPLNLVIDVKVRDICEYFKDCFFKGINTLDEIRNYLYISKLDNNEIILFYTRLIYPSYYFDLYDKIIQNKDKEEKINLYTDKINEYENFLKQVYLIITENYHLPEIEWIIKT